MDYDTPNKKRLIMESSGIRLKENIQHTSDDTSRYCLIVDIGLDWALSILYGRS